MERSLKPNLFIACHDSGGAEILSAWVNENRDRYTFLFYLGGPAIKIFQRDVGAFQHAEMDDLEALFPHGFVLCGTSLESDLERRVIQRAKQMKIKTICFLDHWDLYWERFGARGDLSQLPDELWAGDRYAIELARAEGFPERLLKLVPNPRTQQMLEMAKVSPPPQGLSALLFICEPVSRKLKASFQENACLYDDEYENMRRFLKALKKSPGLFQKVTLRLHPSEGKEKYAGLVHEEQCGALLQFSAEERLVTDLFNHQVVVGVESAALATALDMGRKVVSCITGKQWRISLPHDGIEKITDYNTLFTERFL